jgi:Flp pilus assembly protein TadB
MDEDKAEALGAAAALGLMGGAAYIEGSADARAAKRRQRDRERKLEQRNEKRRIPRENRNRAARTDLAKERLTRLQEINTEHLTKEDKQIRNQLIKDQKEIIKGNKPIKPTSLLRSLGLRALPAVGAFISAVTPTPAYGQGGKVCRGRSAATSAEKAR